MFEARCIGFEARRLGLGEHLSPTDASCSSRDACAVSAGRLTFELQAASQLRQRAIGFASASTSAAAGGGGFNPLFTLARAAQTAQQTVQRKFKVVKVQGDGRCMFRALAKGLAFNQGQYLAGEAETQDADELRLAVAEALCGPPSRRADFKDALLAIKAEYELDTYCKHIRQPGFWGGEAELLVLSKLLQVPVVVYLSNKDAKRKGAGYAPIAKYGKEHLGKRKPVRLLYTGGNHYDLITT